MSFKKLLLIPFAALLLSSCDFSFSKIFNFSKDNKKEEDNKQPLTPQKPTGEEDEDPKIFNVTFDAGLGTGVMDPMEVEDGFSIQLPTCTFTAPLGMTFYRWGDEDGLTYKEKAYVTITEDTVFTAYYVDNGKEVYTVSFNANGGTGSMPSVQVEEGLYTLPTCTFGAPNEKVFDYWSVPNASTHYQAGQQINVNGNVVVTANWKNKVVQQFSISYSSNGGSGSISPTVGNENAWVYTAYCTFTAPSGKEFNYWSIDGQTYDEHVAIKLTKNLTALAIWKTKQEEQEEEDDVTLVNLDCGYKNVGIPSNKDNPIEVRTTLGSDASSWFNTDFTDDIGQYRYINGNNVTNPQTYPDGSLKISNKGQGFGSPVFTHEGAKLELRIGLGNFHGTSTTCADKNKDAFRIYFFNISNELLGQINIGGKEVSDDTQEIRKYYTETNASQVAYFEFRCNEQPHNSSGKYMNLGISYCNIKSWERI